MCLYVLHSGTKDDTQWPYGGGHMAQWRGYLIGVLYGQFLQFTYLVCKA